jgi:hypothetical protein
MKYHVLNNKHRFKANKNLLLLDFEPGLYNKPDYSNAAIALLRNNFTFKSYGKQSFENWMLDITRYKFTLVPHGESLDTYRVMEIFLMGGIPVMKKSSITSCYDDSDNLLGDSKRGSLPVVIVDTWREVTKQRLEIEWQRIIKVSPDNWDWSRIFSKHWLERIDS